MGAVFRGANQPHHIADFRQHIVRQERAEFLRLFPILGVGNIGVEFPQAARQLELAVVDAGGLQPGMERRLHQPRHGQRAGDFPRLFQVVADDGGGGVDGFDVVGVAPGGPGAIGNQFAGLGDAVGVDAGHQHGAVGYLPGGPHHPGAGGGDVNRRGFGGVAMANPALRLAKGHGFAVHQRFQHRYRIPHLPHGGRGQPHGGGGAIAAPNPNLHPPRGDFRHRLGGGGNDRGVAGYGVGDRRGHPNVLRGPHRRRHADEHIALQHLRVQNAHAGESGLFALAHEIRHHRGGLAGGNPQINLDAHSRSSGKLIGLAAASGLPHYSNISPDSHRRRNTAPACAGAGQPPDYNSVRAELRPILIAPQVQRRMVKSGHYAARG